MTEDEIAAIPERRGWSKAAREACWAFEREHDVEVVSIEHHTTWVDRAEKAEAEVEALTAERDAAREALRPGSLTERAPTVWAYEQTCAALHARGAEVETLRKTLAALDGVIAIYDDLCPQDYGRFFNGRQKAIVKEACHRSRLTPDPERER